MTEQKKRQVGRPRGQRRPRKKRVAADKRTHLVGVRLSEKELEELTAEASACGLKNATLLRLCWGGTPVAVKPKTSSVLVPSAVAPRQLTATELVDYRLLLHLYEEVETWQARAEWDTQERQSVRALLAKLHHLADELRPPYVAVA
jgi:hypothetical protein